MIQDLYSSKSNWQLVYCTNVSAYVREKDVPVETESKLAEQLSGTWLLTNGGKDFNKKITFANNDSYSVPETKGEESAPYKYWAKDGKLYLQSSQAVYRLKEDVWVTRCT